MNTITIDHIVYNIHPTYKSYAASEHGEIVNIIERKPVKMGKFYSDHSCFRMKIDDEYDFKYYHVNEFVWECFNSSIPEGKVINHFNDSLEDNRFKNLNLITYNKMILIKRQKMKKLKPQIKNLAAKMKKLELPIEKLKAETEGLEIQMEKLEDEMEPLETQMEKLEDELDRLKTMKCCAAKKS